MSDVQSEYPAAIDAVPAYLADDHDFVPADALTFLVNQIAAIQNAIGGDAVDYAAFGGIAGDYSNLAAFYGALFRYESGTTLVTSPNNYEPLAVLFTPGRFTEPPFVMVTGSNTTTPGIDSHFEAKNVTTEGFEVGDALLASGWPAGKYVNWVAILPLWGLEQDLEF